jgi:DNA-directed RNA polymerase specialized sigma24 family protein
MDSEFRAFFHEEYDGMLRLAYTLVSRLEDAEDAVQSAFLDVARNQRSIRRPGAYLRTAVVSHCRTVLRRRLTAGRPYSRPPVDPGADVGDLTDVLDGLSERTRTVLVLRYYADLSSVEIGRLLDCPAATVRSILRRGLKRLEEELS